MYETSLHAGCLEASRDGREDVSGCSEGIKLLTRAELQLQLLLVLTLVRGQQIHDFDMFSRPEKSGRWFLDARKLEMQRCPSCMGTNFAQARREGVMR